MQGKASSIQKESTDTVKMNCWTYLSKFPVCSFSPSIIYSMQPIADLYTWQARSLPQEAYYQTTKYMVQLMQRSRGLQLQAEEIS